MKPQEKLYQLFLNATTAYFPEHLIYQCLHFFIVTVFSFLPRLYSCRITVYQGTLYWTLSLSEVLQAVTAVFFVFVVLTKLCPARYLLYVLCHTPLTPQLVVSAAPPLLQLIPLDIHSQVRGYSLHRSWLHSPSYQLFLKLRVATHNVP